MPDIELDEYEINPNTIKYHSRTKRFFRAFTPKIMGTSSAFVASGAALAAVVGGVLTGGVLPIVVGAASGITAAVSAVATVSLGVDAATVSRARYKNQGVEGTKKIVEKMESEAYYFVQALERLQQSGDKTIKLKDGYYYNEHQIKSFIAGYEKEAYQGVKYLMAQAEKNTKEIEKLRKAGKLSPSQEKNRKKLWDELDLIGECVRNITSKRNDVNPYKNVIIKALHKGCLIGANDAENEEIRAHKSYNKMSFTEELYHNMYEKVLLTANPPKPEVKPAVTPKPEAKPAAKTNTKKAAKTNTKRAAKATKASTPKPEPKTAKSTKVSTPKPEPKTEKGSFGQRIIRKLISMTKEGKRLIAEEEEAERLRDENDILHASYIDVVDSLNFQKGISSRYKTEADNLKAQVETLEQDVAGARVQANNYKKRYEGAVRRGFNKRAEAIYFRERMEEAEDNLAGNIMANLEERTKMEQEIEHTQDKLKKEQQAHKRATRHVEDKVVENRELNKKLDTESALKNEAKTIIMKQGAEIGALSDKLSAEKDARIEAEKNSKVANETVTSLTASQEELKRKLSQVESDLDSEKSSREAAAKKPETTPLEAADKDFICIYKKVNKHANQVDSSDILHQYAVELIQKASEKYEEAKNAYAAGDVENLTRITEKLKGIYKYYKKAKLLPPYDSGNVKPLGQ